jgi:hypothetical protein
VAEHDVVPSRLHQPWAEWLRGDRKTPTADVWRVVFTALVLRRLPADVVTDLVLAVRANGQRIWTSAADVQTKKAGGHLIRVRVDPQTGTETPLADGWCPGDNMGHLTDLTPEARAEIEREAAKYADAIGRIEAREREVEDVPCPAP